MPQDRILVTGATGFVGHHVVSQLLSIPRPLTLAVRNVARCPTSWRGDPRVKFDETGDLATSPLTNALDGVSTIVHLAGLAHIRGSGAQDVARFMAANADATKRLAQAAAERGVHTFIHLSSLAVITANASPEPVSDATDTAPQTPYGISKKAAEAHVRKLAEQGTFAISLRPPLIVGAEAKGNWGALQRLAATGLPLPFASIRNRRSLIGVGTVAALIAELCARPWSPDKSGAYCVCDSGVVSLAEIVREFRAGMGQPPRLVRCPQALLSGLAKLARRPRQAAGLLGNLEIDPSRFRDTFGLTSAPDVREAIREAGRRYAGTPARALGAAA